MHDQDTGTLLRRLRLERGWTQRQAAELLGVSAQAVSKWERGQGCPDVGMLPRLAKIFGVSVEGILDGDLLPAAPDGGNMKKIQFYVCPDCGNILTAAAIHSLVTLTSAATQGSTRSKMVAPAYMTQPGRPMTGVPSS